MSEYPYLPLSTDSYLADTRHLNTAEHGAYLLLLIEAWRRPECSLPDDDEILARLAGLDFNEWLAMKPRVMAFWKRDGRKKSWTQKRLLSERLYVAEKRKIKQDNAAKRWKKTKKADAAAMRNACETDAPPPPHIEDVVVVERAREISPSRPVERDALVRDLQAALGRYGCLMESSPQLAIISVPAAWLAAGCDLQADILPAVRAQAEQMAQRNDPPSSWKAFERSVLKARDARLSPIPPVQQRAAGPPPQRRSARPNILDISERLKANERAKNQLPDRAVELLPADRQ